MNKKTFVYSLVWFVIAVTWLVFLVVEAIERNACFSMRLFFHLFLAIVLVLSGGASVVNEFKKKRRRHIEDVHKNKIP